MKKEKKKDGLESCTKNQILEIILRRNNWKRTGRV